jgi:hypothetical protein
MTEQEHKLVVFMLAQQQQRFMALVEALKSKGVLEADDVRAYEALLFAENVPSIRSFASIAAQYEQYAEALGLQVNLKDRDIGRNPNASR